MQEVKLSNLNRINKRQTEVSGKKTIKNTDTHQFVSCKASQMQARFGYSSKSNDPKMIRQMCGQFYHKTEAKFANRTKLRCKRLGNKDKYERNLQTGKFLKNNPLTQALKKIERIINHNQKIIAFKLLKYEFG